MNRPRKAKQEEINQLTRYIMNKTNYLEDEARAVIEQTRYVAVFDQYVDYGYAGRMMVVIGDNSISEVFTWDSNCQLHSALDVA